MRVAVPEFDTYLPYFSARLTTSSNIRRNLMSVECMKLSNSTRKISLSISVELSVCEGKKKSELSVKEYNENVSD
jgi:hypothetical protein